ncbi:MAG: hypothetical protein KAH86_09750 [Methanosarcinales archaeon]|nr:hypothetical protein [Methanosarcinales archaeon]
MVKITKIILSILLLFALLAVSGCADTDSNADDASSEIIENTAMEEATTEESAVVEEVVVEETDAEEEDVEETVSTNATLHECTSCHDDEVYTMDEMRTGIHKEAFAEGNSAMHVDKCSECHNVKVDCASADCHALPEVMKAQVTT